MIGDIPKNPLDATGTEVWSLADRYKLWLLERLDVVTQKYTECLNGTLSPEQVRNFETSILVLYVHLKDKVERNKNRIKNGLSEKDSQTLKDLIENPTHRRDTFQTSQERFSFWVRVFNFEVSFLDMLGLTKIDREKYDTAVS